MEMIVAIGLLSLVMIVLFSLFNQTTKAMRANSNQTDVMEGARSGLEILSHDLENMTVSGVAGAPNFVTYPSDSGRELFRGSVQELGTALVPIHQDLFFLQRADSKRVKVVGFVVRNEDRSDLRSLFPIGTLYRYEDPDPRNAANLNPTLDNNINQVPIVLTSPNSRENLAYRMLDRTRATLGTTTDEDGPLVRSATMANLARVADGVVSFRVTAYDQLNRPLDSSIWNYPAYGSTAPIIDGRLPQPPTIANFSSLTLSNRYAATGQSIFIRSAQLPNAGSGSAATAFVASLFTGEQVPTTVEIELAILEPRALDQIRALAGPGNSSAAPGASPREKYLKRNIGRIQIFRQRVPIRVANR